MTQVAIEPDCDCSVHKMWMYICIDDLKQKANKSDKMDKVCNCKSHSSHRMLKRLRCSFIPNLFPIQPGTALCWCPLLKHSVLHIMCMMIYWFEDWVESLFSIHSSFKLQSPPIHLYGPRVCEKCHVKKSETQIYTSIFVSLFVFTALQ